MEFGFEPVYDHVRAGSSCLDMSRQLEPGRRPVRSGSKPNSITLSWSQIGPRLVADLSQICLLVLARELDDRPNSSSLQVCDQPRAYLRPG